MSRTHQLVQAGAALLISAILLCPQPGRGEQAGAAPSHPPPARLSIVPGEHAGDGAALLAPAAKEWEKAAATAILLSRTPRIFQTEPSATRPAPALEVRALRAGERLYLRLSWEDATRNAAQAPPRKAGEGGQPGLLYRRHTGSTSSFADAAAVMVPDRWQGPGFPSLQMGSAESPARMYYWNASRGAEELLGSGRATPRPTGKSLRHQAAHADGRWLLTFELPAPDGTSPVAFALWDGEPGDRDGLKWFSIWYVLKGRPGPSQGE